jgi:hypothetical protein
MAESGKENAATKSWLTESVALFLTPAFAYFLAFSYEQGYCGTFGLPSYFIKPDLTEILVFTTVAMSGYSIFWFWVIDAWAELGTVNPDPRLRPWQHLIHRYFPLLTLFGFIYFVYQGFWQKWIIFLFIVLLIPLVDIISVILKRPDGRTFTEKWHNTNAWADQSGIFFRIRRRMGRAGALLIIFTIIGSILAASIGNSQALRQTSFLVPSSNTNAIVIRCFGDKFICVELDSKVKKPNKNFFILPMASDNSLKFKLKEIGPLNFQ